MALTKEEVQRIAQLARLHLTDDEIERYRDELAKVLDYIGELQKLDLKNIEPTTQVTGLVNRLRDDVAVPSDAAVRERLLEALPDSENGYVKVKAVFE